MASSKEMRVRINSVKNLAQVTRALETVSASKVRKAMAAVAATRPYADKAWQILTHLAKQPGHASLHPLLTEREDVRNVLVLMVSGDRGLAGAYNVNILRHTLMTFRETNLPVSYLAIGRKGRDMLLRRRMNVIADFSNLPASPSFMDLSAIGKIAVEDYLTHQYDKVYIAYTEFQTMSRQEPVVHQLLPLGIEYSQVQSNDKSAMNEHSVFSYEPDQKELLDVVVPRFTALQIYQAILSSIASEHSARMVAMHNATENTRDLIRNLTLDYNKVRQQAITNDMLDIAGGANAQM